MSSTQHRTQAKQGSLLWYEQRLGEPLFVGAKLTLREVVLHMCEAALQHNIRDTALSALLKYYSALCQPEGSSFPPSTYICLQLIAADSLDDVMYHCCSACGRHVWGHTPRDLWQNFEDDVCPYEGCGTRRFKSSSRSPLEPNAVSILVDILLTCTICLTERHPVLR